MDLGSTLCLERRVKMLPNNGLNVTVAPMPQVMPSTSTIT